MGILARPAQCVEALGLPDGFSVCELGNQIYRVDGRKLPATAWYERIGCGRYVSLDANGRATHFADLNHALPDALRAELGLFDMVTDFGTGEHIFDQAQVWETLHDLVKVGGFIVFDRPKTGWAEHCFYNLHETLIRDIAVANEYAIVHLETHPFPDHGEQLLGILQKSGPAAFRYPTQGKYRAMLQQAQARPAQPPATQPAPRLKRDQILAQMVGNYGWQLGAEIGIATGKRFFRLLDAVPTLSMIAVDNWAADDKDYGHVHDHVAVGAAFRARCASDYTHRSLVLHGDSVEMAQEVGDGTLDFVFIDACHDYARVAADIAAWAPKVRSGGGVLGHDWDSTRFPGVVRAVTERFGTPSTFDDHVWGVLDPMTLAVLTYAWHEPNGKQNHKYVYGPEHVLVLRRMLDKHLTRPHELVVVTDRVQQFADGIGATPGNIRIVPIDWAKHLPGKCFVRLMTFRPDGASLFGADHVLQIDLDTVIVGNMDALVNRSENLVLWHNPRRVPWATPKFPVAISWYNGSMMLHRCGSMPEVWREFDPAAPPPQVRDDQEYFGWRFGPHAPYWDGRDGVYRLEVPEMTGSGVGAELPANAKVVFFPGDARKPWQADMQAQYPWIAEHLG